MNPVKKRRDRSRIAPTEEEIAECAYWIWESEGHPLGREEEHWRQAETQLFLSRALDDALESKDETI
ncbi:MAG TPA: DUF2934 domain-containing protein [Chthoniobacteraceae bacterium]|nr:DUF2934 domain-containing protein [Chthoniobacteraceae bacterium]